MLFCPTLMTTLWTLRAQTQNVWLDFGCIFTGVERLTDETRWYGGWKIEQLQIYSGVLHSLYKVRRNGIKGLKEQKKLTPIGLDLMQETITGLRVQCLTNWANQAFACKSEIFRSLCNHAILILTKSSKSKNQVVHEQKFSSVG